MNNYFQNMQKIESGLSKKKIFRKIDKNLNKIFIDFSNDKNEFFNFLKVYQILNKVNVSIPKIYEVNINKKLIVMEDFGDNRFDKIYKERDFFHLLKIAVDNLIVIHNSLNSDDLCQLKQYSYSDFKNEISEFVDYFIPYKMIPDFPKNEFYNCWEHIYNIQKFNFTSFVHKDYEFINLIFLKNNNFHLKCGIIDFQSAFKGFIGWDLFSVLENSRINFPRKYNDELIKYFYNNVNVGTSFKTFLNQYYLLNLGRQTRLLGRWIKLFNQENKMKYKNYIDTTLIRINVCLNNIQRDKLRVIYLKALKSNV